MEKSGNRLYVYVGYFDGKFSAAVKGFHRFQIREAHITTLFAELENAIQNHKLYCQISKYAYPEILKGEYEICYRYSLYAVLALMPDFRLLSKETSIPYLHLREYESYVRKPTKIRYKRIFEGINSIGKKISALQEPDFSICTNDELIAEYSGLALFVVKSFKYKKVQSEALSQKILKAMHQIGALYQTFERF